LEIEREESPRVSSTTTVHTLAAMLAAALTMVGCQGIGLRPSAIEHPQTRVETGANHAVPQEHRALRSATGCIVDTVLYSPSRAQTDGLVILAPGFMRDQRHLANLARSLAGRGIPTLTFNPCNTRPWGGRPVQTGADMVGIARLQGARRVVYGGFSAGALSALIAARLDPHTFGVLALDLVDNRGLGIGMARGLDRPLIGLRGEPARCNAHNNALPVFAAAPKGRLSAIPGASHCDFESPTDWLCEALCQGGGPGAWPRSRDILERAVGQVVDLLAVPRGSGPPETKQLLTPRHQDAMRKKGMRVASETHDG
jgi:hypothetical protein